jgi:hypothetical protein
MLIIFLSTKQYDTTTTGTMLLAVRDLSVQLLGKSLVHHLLVHASQCMLIIFLPKNSNKNYLRCV